MSDKRKQKIHSPELFLYAKRLISVDGFSIRKASKETGIPFQTLRDHVNGKYSSIGTSFGPSRLLSDENEQSLSNYAVFMAKRGVPLSRQVVKRLAQDIIKHQGVGDISPSDKWIRSYLKRHPELTCRERVFICRYSKYVRDKNVDRRRFESKMLQGMDKYLIQKHGVNEKSHFEEVAENGEFKMTKTNKSQNTKRVDVGQDLAKPQAKLRPLYDSFTMVGDMPRLKRYSILTTIRERLRWHCALAADELKKKQRTSLVFMIRRLKELLRHGRKAEMRKRPLTANGQVYALDVEKSFLLRICVDQVPTWNDVNVRVASDRHDCNILDMCQMPDGSIILIDTSNKKLKILDEEFNVKDFYQFD